MRFRRLHAAAACIAVAFAHLINGSQANSADEMEKILAALKARQAKFENVCITWKETRLHPEGTVQIADALGGEPTKVPETINKYDYQLRLSGTSHFRLDRKGPQWFGSRSSSIESTSPPGTGRLASRSTPWSRVWMMAIPSGSWEIVLATGTQGTYFRSCFTPLNDQYAPLTSIQYTIDPDLALVGEKSASG